MKILIAEDDDYTRAVTKEYLKKEKYFVLEANNGKKTLEICERVNPDVLILDIMLPDIEGTVICNLIRSEPSIYGEPLIIFLTSKTKAEDVRKGFELGGDDYLRKPFDPIELVLRIKSWAKTKKIIKNKIYNYSNLEIHTDTFVVKENGNEIKMTKNEYELLLYFVINQGLVRDRERIYAGAWDKEFSQGRKNVEIYTKRLKTKFRCIEENLETVTGFGYRLKKDENSIEIVE